MYDKSYYEKHKDKILKYNKDYRKNNPGKNKQWCESYYQRNRERILQQRKKYRKNNKELLRERDKKYRENNRDKARSYQKQYRQLWKDTIKDLGYEIKCQTCGYDKNFSCIDFHHRKPENKDFRFNWLFQRKPTSERIILLKKELKKCDILCNRCHQEIHHPND